MNKINVNPITLEISVEHKKIADRMENSWLTHIRKLISTALKYLKNIMSKNNVYVCSKETKKINRNIYIINRHLPCSRYADVRHKNKRPEWFSYEKVQSRLISTIVKSNYSSRVKLIILYDGMKDELLDDFVYNFPYPRELDVEFQLINGRSAVRSGFIMHDYIKNMSINDEDIIYLLENDYMHRENWLDLVYELYDSEIKFDFITLFDHPGAYTLEVNSKYLSKLYVNGLSIWKTTPGSCFSFIATKKVFGECYKTFINEKLDYKIWTKLIKKKGMVMLSPVPAYATHCMVDDIAPGVDWFAESLVQ